MNEYERYNWDLNGYIVVENVLSPETANAIKEALAGMPAGSIPLEDPRTRSLHDPLTHPAVVSRLNVMCGPGFRIDGMPELLDFSSPGDGPLLRGGGEPRNPDTAYHHQNGSMHCGSVGVILHLGDSEPEEAGFVCVPGSHKTGFPIPESLQKGDDNLGMLIRPKMTAGDLLFFMDGALTHGLFSTGEKDVPRAVLVRYMARNVAGSLLEPEVYWPESLLETMTDEQRAVLHAPCTDEGVPRLAVCPDGEVRIADAQPAWHRKQSSDEARPFSLSDDEKYFFDLKGYLVLSGVLSRQEVEQCNNAIDHYASEITTRCQETTSLAFGAPALRGKTGRREMDGMLGWPAPYREPFRELLVHPMLVARLNELLGEGFRLDNGPRFIGAEKGTEGHRLHGAGEPYYPVHSFSQKNGRFYCRAVTAVWPLSDALEGDGGFAMVPGSHKSSEPVPQKLRVLESNVEAVVQPVMHSGDVLLFTENATHGAFPWQGKHQRRTIFFKYASRGSTRRAGRCFKPEHCFGDWT
ncbi:MAG: phytanoyl-CoA dioxygenase family protein, partial [Pseudomonadota bacterium]